MRCDVCPNRLLIGGKGMNYNLLWRELDLDPLSRGYAGMTDIEAAGDLNTEYRVRMLGRLDTGDVYNSIDVSEFTALTDGQRQEVWDMLHVGGTGLWVRPGDTARTRLISIFGAQSTTIQALAALLVENISRAQELGLGRVRPGHVEKARRIGAG